MKMIYKDALNDERAMGPRKQYWLPTTLLPATVGAVALGNVVGAGLTGNIQEAGKLSTTYAHIIFGFYVLIATGVGGDVDLINNGTTVSYSSGGKELLRNILSANLPANVGPEHAIAIPAAALAASHFSSVRGERFHYKDWFPYIPAGEVFDAVLNVPVALGGLTAGGVLTSLVIDTRIIGYVTERAG